MLALLSVWGICPDTSWHVVGHIKGKATMTEETVIRAVGNLGFIDCVVFLYNEAFLLFCGHLNKISQTLIQSPEGCLDNCLLFCARA